MPTKPKKPCAQPGCPNLTTGEYCTEHKKDRRQAQNKAYDSQRPSPAQRGYDANWRQWRKMRLAENPLCADPFGEHADQGVVVPAYCIDHIIPLRRGGANTAGNLQPLCERCHNRKTALENPTSWRRMRIEQLQPSTIPVTIVAGAPGSGKSTYVREKAKWGDLIIDTDALYIAVSGQTWYEKPETLLPFVFECRDALLERLSSKNDVPHAWFVTGDADVQKLFDMRQSLGGEIVLLETSYFECLLRVSRDERRKDKLQLWEPLIKKWWDKFDRTGGVQKLRELIADGERSWWEV